jgi:tripartite-type tricarboxylate transporter receptor subunit TctC
LWFGFVVPKGTPSELISRLNTEILAVVSSHEFAQAVESEGAFVIVGSPKQFAQRIEADWAALEKMAKAINFGVDK